MDLTEDEAGDDADVFPDGTTKILKKGSMFRFESHYHPYGEQTFDRQKVGIKFYPKGVVPKYVVTSRSGSHGEIGWGNRTWMKAIPIALTSPAIQSQPRSSGHDRGKIVAPVRPR